jgi:excisionase family DNA binding protein
MTRAGQIKQLFGANIGSKTSAFDAMQPTVPMPNLTREFYSRAEFAELMGYSLSTVDEFIRTREISWHKKGRNVRISREAIVAFILSGTVQARDGGLPAALSQAQRSVLRALLEEAVREILSRSFNHEIHEIHETPAHTFTEGEAA